MKKKSQSSNKKELMNEPLDIFCCLDGSGSMLEIRSATILAFNKFLKQHRKDDPDHTTKITVDLFNTGTTTLWTRAPLFQVEGLSRENYRPGGQTAMLDSIGKAITDADTRSVQSHDGSLLPENRIQNVLIALVSDGRENASLRFGFAEIRELIQEHLTDEKWDIVFLTSDDHAKRMAIELLGIPEKKVEMFECTAQGIQESFEKISRAAREKKSGRKITDQWKDLPKAS